MHNFIKRKLYFTVALLVFLVILNPYIFKFWPTGYSLLGFQAKVIYPYYATIIFLGIAAYFYSLHFFSRKRFKLHQNIGNVCYSIALSVSALYMLLFVASYLLQATKTKVGILSLWILLIMASSGLVSILAYRIIRSIANRDKVAREKQYKNEGYSFIERSQLLFNDGYYDISVIEAFKALESSLRKSLFYSIKPAESHKPIALIDKAEEMKVITSDEARKLHSFRLTRNNLLHGEGTITKDESREIIENTKSIVFFLTNLELSEKSPEAFNWLMKNYSMALEVVKKDSHPDLSMVVNYLIEAWQKHGASISKDISIFFAQALINNTSYMINWFSENINLLSQWIYEIGFNMFTDSTGGKKKELKHLKQSILRSLTDYIDETSDIKKKQLAQHIKNRTKCFTYKTIA